MSLLSAQDEAISSNINSRRRRHHSSSDDAIAAAEAAASSINSGSDASMKHNNTSRFSSLKRRGNGTPIRNVSFTKLHSSLRKIPKIYQRLLMVLLAFPVLAMAVHYFLSDPPSITDGGVVYYPPKPTHHHAIPPYVIFTYHTNLLTTPEESLSDEEDRALSLNVQHIVSLHQESTVRFLNDDDCKNSIRATLGEDTKLIDYFDKETHGMYKADICRGAALYETGGLYFDIDIEAKMSLWSVIDKKTEFVTVLVHKDSNHHGGFFQAFIGVVPQHKVMKRYVELFVEYYEGKVKVNGPLGVYFLRMAYDELNEEEKTKSELWQEVRYHEKLFPNLKDPPLGKRRACQMLVAAQKKRGRKEESVIPFYSHARGSRMCGGKDTNKKGGDVTRVGN
jgi:hypothetical protein